MTEIEFDRIEPFLKKCTVSNEEITCVFRCPQTSEEYESSAPLRRSNNEKHNFYDNFRRGLVSALKNSAGMGHIGTEFYEPLPIGEFQREEVADAIIRAFLNSGEFFFSAVRGEWISHRAAGTKESAFEKQLRLHPVSDPQHRQILIRVMVSLANVDGEMSEREMVFLMGFLENTRDEIINTLARSMPDRVELSLVARQPVCETILMLAWTVVLTDGKLEENESVNLASLAEYMDIPFRRSLELKKIAQHYILEKAIEHLIALGKWDVSARNSVIGVGEKIGLDTDLCERAIEAYFRRNPLPET